VKGINGAEAVDYVDGKYKQSVNKAQPLYGQAFPRLSSAEAETILPNSTIGVPF
jgi:hypothetical protein